jgi:hypothetical protein
LPAAPELRETLKEIDVTISANNRIHVGLPGEALPFATYALSSDGTTSPTAIDDGLLDRFALEIESRVKVVQQRGRLGLSTYSTRSRVGRHRAGGGGVRYKWVVEAGLRGRNEWLRHAGSEGDRDGRKSCQRAARTTSAALPCGWR